MLQPGDVRTHHPTLGAGCHRRTDEEGPVPQSPAMVAGLDPQVECHAAQYQPHQHDGHGQVEVGQDDAVGQGEGDEQNSHTQHDPGFVGVPEGADGGHHQVFLGFVGQRQEHADTEVVTVQDDVNQQRQAHRGHVKNR